MLTGYFRWLNPSKNPVTDWAPMESLPLSSVPSYAAYLDFRESSDPDWYDLPNGSIVAIKLPMETLYFYKFNWAFITSKVDPSAQYKDTWFYLNDDGIPINVKNLALSKNLFDYDYEILNSGY